MRLTDNLGKLSRILETDHFALVVHEQIQCKLLFSFIWPQYYCLSPPTTPFQHLRLFSLHPFNMFSLALASEIKSSLPRSWLVSLKPCLGLPFHSLRATVSTALISQGHLLCFVGQVTVPSRPIKTQSCKVQASLIKRLLVHLQLRVSHQIGHQIDIPGQFKHYWGDSRQTPSVL